MKRATTPPGKFLPIFGKANFNLKKKKKKKKEFSLYRFFRFVGLTEKKTKRVKRKATVLVFFSEEREGACVRRGGIQ